MENELVVIHITRVFKQPQGDEVLCQAVTVVDSKPVACEYCEEHSNVSRGSLSLKGNNLKTRIENLEEQMKPHIEEAEKKKQREREKKRDV